MGVYGEVTNMQNNLPQRKPIRWDIYDYSRNGAYFVTFNVKGNHHMLGKIMPNAAAPPVGRDDPGTPSKDTHPTINLSEHGKIAEKFIKSIELHYKGVSVDTSLSCQITFI